MFSLLASARFLERLSKLTIEEAVADKIAPKEHQSFMGQSASFLSDFHFSELMQRVQALAPEIVYMVAYFEDGLALLQTASETSFQPRLFVGMGSGFTLLAAGSSNLPD